ncbi:MAG: S9 family peptidase, partial [Acidobacteriota bacterium]|nr:S9 family peptidase [Acidobacteriota bacterium]
MWDYDGNLVHQVADLELKEEVPTGFGSVPTGPRAVGWRADASATLYWAEAQDGGDSRRDAEIRDTVFMVSAPFDKTPRKLIDLGYRYGGIQWGTDEVAVVTAWWWRTRQARAWRVEPGRPGAKPDLLIEISFEDRYADPGDPVTHPNPEGRSVLMFTAKGGDLFLIGAGASEEGDRPFLDTFDLETKESKRLFRSEAPYYEMPVAPLDTRARKVLTRRESRDEPPNYFVRDLETGELRQLTDFPHPTPQLLGIRKEQIRYEREDGVMLTATLYLPPGYKKEDGPLPLLVWAYPQEFKSADAAGQVTDSPYRFDRVGWWSSLLFLTLGYAVLDDPSLPIVGEGEEEPN